MSVSRVDEVLGQLDLSFANVALPFWLRVGPVVLRVDCPRPLRDTLVDYFDEVLCEETPATARISLLPGQSLAAAPDWIEWRREGGKTGRKDAYYDLRDGRLIHKVRTGVTFLQSPQALIAFGPLDENVSTVINFINTQVLNICQREGWQICHAAAVTNGARTLAIAGLSGGGKSTSILRMMDLPGTRFVSNDRLLVRGGSPVQALGIPKQPRINPGTILGNPQLQGMLGADEQARLRAMPLAELWDLEEKHDLFIRQAYGQGRVQYEAPLTHFWVLNWQRGGDVPTRIEPVDLAQRPDLLGAIMKSAGPFYQGPDGTFLSNGATPDPAGYLAALDGVRVCEVSGGVDFDALSAVAQEIFDG